MAIAEAVGSRFMVLDQPTRAANMQDDVTGLPARPDRILRIRAVLDRTGLSRSTLYRRVQEGTFPRQIALGARSAGWREFSVLEWMKSPMSFRADA